jgi:hypothetical protein
VLPVPASPSIERRPPLTRPSVHDLGDLRLRGLSFTKIDGARRVFIEKASAIFARLRASFAGFTGAFVEPHELDAKRTRKAPAKVIGRSLSGQEAAELPDRLA